jgi:hypothetical protein
MKLSVPPQGHRSIIERPASAAGPQHIGKPFGSSSMAREKAVVVVVVSDPKPENSFALKKTDRSMVARNTNGIDRACLADPLELKPWMPRVEHEASVRIPSLVLYFRWELAEEFPEPWVRAGSHILSGSRGVVRPAASSPAASSARAFKTSWDCANRRAHPSSDTSSAWSHPAIRSCSSGGRDDIWEKTSASARVMHLGYCPGDCRTSRCSGRRPVNSRSTFNEPGPRGSLDEERPPRGPGSGTIDHYERPSPLNGKPFGGRPQDTAPMIRKTQLVALLVDLAATSDIEALDDDRVLSEEVCVPRDRHVVRHAGKILARLRGRFSYVNSPAFYRLVQGRTPRVAAMQRRLEEAPARKVDRLEELDSALRGLLHSRVVYDLLDADASEDLRAIEAILKGLANPD